MIVAVDTGGTKTLVAVFNTDGTVVAEHKFPTPKQLDQYLTELKSSIDTLTEDVEITCISVALPGVIIDGRMLWAGNLGWHDTDIRTLLSDHYDCPIIVENDANLAGLAEARALKELPKVCLYVTVSTGIGTGIITNGSIDTYFATSEGGHIVLRHGDTMKEWEEFASGRALREKYGKLASEIKDPAIWDEIADNVAQGFLVLCPILRPDVIVIGGGVGTHFEKFCERLLVIMNKYLREIHVPVIVKASHPEEAVIYGCYYHAIEALAA